MATRAPRWRHGQEDEDFGDEIIVDNAADFLGAMGKRRPSQESVVSCLSTWSAPAEGSLWCVFRTPQPENNTLSPIFLNIVAVM